MEYRKKVPFLNVLHLKVIFVHSDQTFSFFMRKMLNQEEFLQKYGEIIKEEVNVKEI
mgnify:CR=1 FL=1